jgi:predicted transcriptional regulator
MPKPRQPAEKRIPNYEKIYRLFLSHPDDLFSIGEIERMSGFTHKQVHRAMQALKEKDLVQSFIEQYTGFGKRRSYYGLTERIYRSINMERRQLL